MIFLLYQALIFLQVFLLESQIQVLPYSGLCLSETTTRTNKSASFSASYSQSFSIVLNHSKVSTFINYPTVSSTLYGVTITNYAFVNAFHRMLWECLSKTYQCHNHTMLLFSEYSGIIHQLLLWGQVFLRGDLAEVTMQIKVVISVYAQ